MARPLNENWGQNTVVFSEFCALTPLNYLGEQDAELIKTGVRTKIFRVSVNASKLSVLSK